MKKILSLAVVFALALSCLTVFASAAQLPFEPVAPANVNAEWLEGGDSPTTVSISYSLSNEMTAFFKRLETAHANDTVEEFFAQYDFDDIGITTQVDWAIDDVDDPVSGWHYNEFWNAIEGYGLGYDDQGRCRVGVWDGVDLWIGNATETVNSHWILRSVNEDELKGNPETLTPGLRDQLRADQFSVRDGDVVIDFTEHTAFFRMRFVVWTSKDTEEGTKYDYTYSDWSETASVGKGAEAYKPLTAADLAAPVVTDLHMTDENFNENPVVAFTLTVPDELAANAAKVAARGGEIRIETEARIKGDAEWVLMQNTDWIIRAGEMKSALLTLLNEDRPVIPDGAEIEIRFRYLCMQSGEDDVFSDYSAVQTFKTTEIRTDPQPVVIAEPDEDSEPVDVEGLDADQCPICGFCPQPLGLCIFIWIAILVTVIIVIVVVIVIVKKKKKKE